MSQGPEYVEWSKLRNVKPAMHISKVPQNTIAESYPYGIAGTGFVVLTTGQWYMANPETGDLYTRKQFEKALSVPFFQWLEAISIKASECCTRMWHLAQLSAVPQWDITFTKGDDAFAVHSMSCHALDEVGARWMVNRLNPNSTILEVQPHE